MSEPIADPPAADGAKGPGPLGRRSPAWAAGFLLLAGAIGGVGFFLLRSRSVPGTDELRQELRDRGRIAVVGAGDLLALSAPGSELVLASSVPGLLAALAGTDDDAFADVLARQAIAGILVDGRRGGSLEPGASIEARLRADGLVPAVRGVYLTPAAALYERERLVSLEPAHADALAHVARSVIGGAPPPQMRSFPEPLRRTRNVEVMVMLEQNGRPRLWRSARSGSIARGLLTAAGVARQRWTERQQTMGPLDRELPRMIVKVFLLQEDGTIGDRAPGFLDRVITPEHGAGFEDRSSWHYLLPAATRERGQGSAVRAYRELFEESQVREGGLERSDLRLYRLVAREIAVSPATTSAAGGDEALDLLLEEMGAAAP